MSKSKTRQPAGRASSVNRNKPRTPTSPANKTLEKTVASTEDKTEVKAPEKVATSTQSKAEVKAPEKVAASSSKKAETLPAVTHVKSEKSSVPASTPRPVSKDALKRDRRIQERQQRVQQEQRQKQIKIWSLVALVVVLVGSSGIFAYWYFIGRTSNASANGSTSPMVESTVYNSNYMPIDNIYCDQLEGSVEHIHAHLTMYINGSAYTLPASVGIPVNSSTGSSTCYYWLHVHNTDGIIHIEAPTTQNFTLGQFIDEWNQGFSSLGFPTQLLLADGWTVWVNGVKYNGKLTSVPLTSHALVTIAYNSPNAKADKTFSWPSGY